MTKNEHIEYWLAIADKDWEIVQKLYQSGDYMYCLFFCHLVIEKISKAIWVKNHETNIPPKIHNIINLLDESQISFDNEKSEFLLLLNEFNIEARYPDYKQKIFRICDKTYTDDMLKKVKDIRQCLLSKMQ